VTRRKGGYRRLHHKSSRDAAATSSMHARRSPGEGLDELELRSGLRAAREAFALLHHLPLLCDHPERIITILRHTTLYQPTSDHKTRPANPTTAVYSGDPSASLVVAQDGEDVPDELDRLGEAPVPNRKIVVLYRVDVDAQQGTTCREVRIVREELMGLCEVKERLHACQEQCIKLLLGVFACDLGRGEWAVGELAGDEVRCRPVRVWNGAGSVAEGGGFLNGAFEGRRDL